MTPNEALKNLITLVSNVADAHTTALLIQERDGMIRPRQHLSLSPHFDPKMEIAPDDSLFGPIVNDHRALLKDYSEDETPDLPLYTQPEDLKGLCAVPVDSEGVRGILLVDSKEEYTFSTKLQKILASFAKQVAWHIAQEQCQPYWVDGEPDDFTRMIKWCRFLAESPDRKTLSERFMHIPKNLLIVDALALVWFKSDGTGKVTRARGWDPSLRRLQLLTGDDTLCGSCERTGDPILIRNVADHSGTPVFHADEEEVTFNSLIIAPIVTQKRLQGLMVAARRPAESLAQADLDRLSLMTAFGALALDNSEMRSQWEHDKNLCQVTGIPNHRFLASHLNSIEQVVLRDKTSLSVMTLNAKNLNGIYEQFGLETGDRFLEEMVTLTLDAIKDPKFIFRYSESALVVLLMDRSLEEAEQQLESLESRFQNNSFSIDGHTMKPKIEFGLASSPEDGSHLGDLIGASWSQASQSKVRAHV